MSFKEFSTILILGHYTGPSDAQSKSEANLMNLDAEKLMTLFLIALVVLGPQRLPEAARTLGRGLAELKKYRAVVQSEMNHLLQEPRAVINEARHSAMVVKRAEPERNASYVRPDSQAVPDNPDLN